MSSISPQKLTTVRKNWRLGVNVLKYLSCVHIKRVSALITTKPKKQEWKTWGKSGGMWCDAFSNSCVHSVFFRKMMLFHSQLISPDSLPQRKGAKAHESACKKKKKLAFLDSHTCPAVRVHITGRPSITKHISNESSTVHYSWVISNMSRKSCELRSSSRPGTRPTAVRHTQPKCPVDRRGTASCSLVWQPGSPTKNIQTHCTQNAHVEEERGKYQIQE